MATVMRAAIGSELSCMAEAVYASYRNGQEDELMEPIVSVDASGRPRGRMGKGEWVIFYNIRGEREVELSQALTDPEFGHFPRPPGLLVKMATMIEYSRDLDVLVAFPPIRKIEQTLSEVLSRHGIRQLKVVESEKAIHVSYFFNGKNPDPFPLEEYAVIPSDKSVATFDQLPEMAIGEVSRVLCEKLSDGRYGFVLGNFANVDVVGHNENERAVIKAVEAVDYHTGVVVAAARRAGVITLITADHGSVEKRLYPDGAIDTGHSDSPVPFVIVPPDAADGAAAGIGLRPDGDLTDVAPTVLDLLGIPPPPEMTGRSLLMRQGPPFSSLQARPRILLLILDGWGLQPAGPGNLIDRARTPVMDELLGRYPWTALKAAGIAVGMPSGSVGNSESGHLHLGAGRRIPSDLVRIDEAVRNGSFMENPAFLAAMRESRINDTPLHLMGIVSFYSSHGSLDHLFALMEMAKRQGLRRVFIHSLLGRRGERPHSGAIYVDKVEKKAAQLGVGEVVTVMGRYWAMDREENWDRVEKAYRALVGLGW